MQTRILLIEGKLRSYSGAVRPSDFRVRDGDEIDARIVVQEPNPGLYCLDLENRQALFVETPPECDLSRAPFL